MWSVSKFIPRPVQSLFNFQIAEFSKYISKSRTKRLPLTTKRVGKGYKKGNGARTEGKLNSKGLLILIFVKCSNIKLFSFYQLGQFRKLKEMCTELIVPDLSGFALKPYVGVGAKRHVKDIEVKF